MRGLTALLLAVGLLGGAATAQANTVNVISDGDLSSPQQVTDLPGAGVWTVPPDNGVPDGFVTLSPVPALPSSLSPSGITNAFGAGSTAEQNHYATLGQVFSVPPGETVAPSTLTFWLYSTPTRNRSAAGTNGVYPSAPDLADTGWQKFTYADYATLVAGFNALIFGFWTDNDDTTDLSLVMTDSSLDPLAPELAFLALLGTGLLALGLMRRRRPRRRRSI